MKLKSINAFKALKNWFGKRSLAGKIILILILLLGGGWTVNKIFSKKATTPQYQTAQVEKGTLVAAVSASGNITSGNNTSLATKVSGVVNKVYVTNGDTVTKGQKIAEITLDDYAQERQTDAWAAYLDATVAVKEAINAKALADIQMWNDRQAVLDAQQAMDDMNDNDTNPATHAVYTDGERMIITKTLDQTRKAFSVSESKYLNANADIANANAKVAAALRNYQENSATIIAPTSGTISDLALAPGIVITASSTTSNTSGATIVSPQTIGKITNSNGQLIATVGLSEIDIINVKANQKVTLTLDAFPDKSFTGKVLAVNTNGQISSGVTNYPATILLDTTETNIYPNMAVTANIITNVDNDVLLVPSAAILTTSGQTQVRVLKNGQVTSVDVVTGDANDTQTVIVSGVNEGDTVVTSVLNSTGSTGTSTGQTGTSVFGGGGFGGAGRIIGR